MAPPATQRQPYYIIALLILAGEAVFILPFVLARVFRPTVLEVFNLNNLELGLCFSVYGVVALISYLFGGPLADRFHPRLLMGTALVLTAFGGFYYATFPPFLPLQILYGYWGFTTIFLFWAAMIKATRMWGGSDKQGTAFGFLDGGRGLVAASFGLLGVVVFTYFVSSEIGAATITERKNAFREVILVSSFVILVIAGLVFLFLRPKPAARADTETPEKLELFKNFRTVSSIPSVWLLMVIILCAYTGYKTTDIFSLYAREVMLFNEIEAAQVGTFLLYIRPITGVMVGFLADKSRGSVLLVVGFIVMLFGSILFASGVLGPTLVVPFLLGLLVTALGVYAARVLYFAVLREGKIPLALTGTAVGLISLVGYMPDIFAGPAMGYLLDASPGETGHQHTFWMLAVFSLIGLLASLAFYRIARK
ncbi:MAG: MFS transporter [Flavobacteriaceae bacterium]|nr:MFS transporter [Flavobacteriaceae bacterium]